MGQLIKLENYISRYQQDPYHYPSQYMRLKQDNWRQFLALWEEEQSRETLVAPEEDQPEESGFFSRWKRWTNKTETPIDDDEVEKSIMIPKSEDQLKQYYLDSIYKFQLKWASSTISQMSFLDKMYQDDFTLRYFMQRFPDTYLFMYNPIFKLKKATVDADIIMITPFEINIIAIVEKPSDHQLIAIDDRTWQQEVRNVRKTIPSPLLSLKRTDKIVRSILTHKAIDMPIKRIVISRTNEIDYSIEPFQTTYIDRNKHDDWLMDMRKTTSTLKHIQLKAIDALLTYSDTVSFSRPEWQEHPTDDFEL